MTAPEAPIRKTPSQWAYEEGYEIYEPNGWIGPGQPAFDAPVTYDQYRVRALNSVLGPPRG